jgi:uncharacterized protein (TIGR02145 family)
MQTKLFLLSALAVFCLAFTAGEDTQPETPETQYTITVTQPSEGGTIAASPTTAVAGTEIELTATVADGYLFVEWTTTTAGVVFADATANPATFSMPERDVTVTAEFERDPKIYDEGVEIGGIIWATRNVDSRGQFVDNPEDYGDYYTFEEAQKACPEGWRTPTDEEQVSLVNVGSGWTTLKGVNGYLFGSGENTIFLPAAGFRRITGTVDGQGSEGVYWSSTAYSGDIGYYLGFNSTFVGPSRSAGFASEFSVRCVEE